MSFIVAPLMNALSRTSVIADYIDGNNSAYIPKGFNSFSGCNLRVHVMVEQTMELLLLRTQTEEKWARRLRMTSCCRQKRRHRAASLTNIMYNKGNVEFLTSSANGPTI